MSDVTSIFARELPLEEGVFLASIASASQDEVHTSEAFSDKWVGLDQTKSDDIEPWKQEQFAWYLRSYGYSSEEEFAEFLRSRRAVLDAGCGPGYKAAWMARLASDTTVVAMDLSDSIHVAAKRYPDIPNLLFVKGDIANTPFADGAFDLVSCDQVLHHTDNPPATAREFARILETGGTLNTYVYSKKALPRELLDEHFRDYSKQLSREEIWELSDQLTQLGKTLSELEISINVPDMPALGIVGGQMDLQRFLYWNFIKCFWNADFGYSESRMTNFDWYAPSTAFRYTAEEFRQMIEDAGLSAEFTRSEEACHTGRFRK
ncbi:MAG: class I SAM-dependent methyltransferase [Citromicrobium sp.]|nr:MAG: class I SAM-dependent methyltransferase [Citromicrobium sp.]